VLVGHGQQLDAMALEHGDNLRPHIAPHVPVAAFLGNVQLATDLKACTVRARAIARLDLILLCYPLTGKRIHTHTRSQVPFCGAVAGCNFVSVRRISCTGVPAHSANGPYWTFFVRLWK
jgi:hypothetical protein